MTDKIREAATRLRVLLTPGATGVSQLASINPALWMQTINDLCDIAAAYLQEHPAESDNDDNTRDG